MPRKLSHVTGAGTFRMVDVSAKPVTSRVAVARGRVFMHRETLALVREERARKGSVLAAAHIAGVMAAKRTSTLIPSPLACRSRASSCARADEDLLGRDRVARADARAHGVEMEALTAVMIAALTIYDMPKSADRGMVMGEFALWEKRRGRRASARRVGPHLPRGPRARAAAARVLPRDDPVAECRGRALRRRVVAAHPLPFRNSSMDLLRCARLISRGRARPAVPAGGGGAARGHREPGARGGRRMRIMTGAMIPEGADA
jgi:cyclic pyranopterin phosphate synthase